MTPKFSRKQNWSNLIPLWPPFSQFEIEGPNKFHNYETEKITCKASDVAEYTELFGSSTRDRHAWRINVILCNVRRYMRHHAWQSRAEEPNNML